MTRTSLHPREEILHGGTTNAGLITRVGDTVRRPRRATSPATRALLDHLAAVGFDGAPRYLGIDDSGREVLSYVPGQAAIQPTPGWALSEDALRSVAQLLRRYHDAACGFEPGAHRWPHPIPERYRGGLISHNDPNLDNIIFRDGRAVALIDFDLAGPGCREWDLACAARLWAPLRAETDLPAGARGQALRRLATFADAYGASEQERARMVEAIVACHDWCYAIVRRAVGCGHEAFGLYWEQGGRSRAERTRRWLASCSPELRAVLGL